jgi:hypothetical protein
MKLVTKVKQLPTPEQAALEQANAACAQIASPTCNISTGQFRYLADESSKTLHREG